MKLSRRARLRQRHYGRMHKAGGLNLVSLMDIFTILVFFLMVNSSDVKVMQNTAKIEKLTRLLYFKPAVQVEALKDAKVVQDESDPNAADASPAKRQRAS